MPRGSITFAGLGKLLRRLVLNEAGNVLILTAALLIPLTALIGSGIDLGRFYVVRERMQLACDAASLAGRRAVSASETSAQVSAEATKYFNYNFPQGSYSTAAFTPTTSVSGDSTQVVTVTASTTLPMSIMTIFGFQTMTSSVTCNAQQNYVNTDIVLVLDTTGSMLCSPGQASCTNTSETSNSKMVGMRSAVLALYDALATAQTQLQSAGLRLRYGVVPFSSAVNIGKSVYGLNPGYMQASSPYYQNVCTGSGKNQSCSYQAVTVAHSTSWYSNTWTGCVEERHTNSSVTATSTSAPSDAYDLDLDLVPTTGTSATALQTQWPPFDPSSEQGNASGQYAPCNTSTTAVPLQAWTRANLNTYLNGLQASGGTLTDVGMVWGGRMLSQTGLWASLNPATYGNMPVNRYVILMTDGAVTAYQGYYGAYGVENLDHRIESSYPSACGGNGYSSSIGLCTADSIIHRQRFSILCNEIKNEGVSIWAIGFGQSFTGSATTDDTAALSNCATNSGQVAYISDSATLVAKFTAIGQTIGALRLTQ